jgi:hypothetical protein
MPAVDEELSFPWAPVEVICDSEFPALPRADPVETCKQRARQTENPPKRANPPTIVKIHRFQIRCWLMANA